LAENDQLSKVGKKTTVVCGYIDKVVKRKSQIKSWSPRQIIVSSDYKGLGVAVGVGDVEVYVGYGRWESFLDGIQ
jgi:hypothetical protein